MNAKKTYNGKWKATIWLPPSEDGKRRRKVFYGRTKREAELLASSYKVVEGQHFTVYDAVAKYINDNAKSLSPATVRGYTTILRSRFDNDFGRTRIDRVDKPSMQRWISESVCGISAKSVSNAYGLVTAAMRYFGTEPPSVKLPQVPRPHLYSPSNEDIRTLLDACKDDVDMRRCILLGAFCGMRRGEIAALTAGDIDRSRCRIYIDKAISLDEHNCERIKPPKTDESNRVIIAPKFVIDEMPKSGVITTLGVQNITHRFSRLVVRAGLPHFRFHDLRHFYATRLKYANIPDRLVQQAGGWKTDKMMKRVYVDVVDEEFIKAQEFMADYFAEEVLTKK